MIWCCIVFGRNLTNQILPVLPAALLCSFTVVLCISLNIFSPTTDSFPKGLTETLSYIPYLIFLETLKRFPAGTEAGRTLRVKALELDILQLVLQCLSIAGHHSPRVENTGADTDTSDQISLEEKYVCVYA